MFTKRTSHSRSSGLAFLLALGSVALGLAIVIVEAVAHHPGSHARRVDGGVVRVEAVAVLQDSCTRVGAVREGTPEGEAQPAAGSIPVTLQLERPADAVCATVIGRGEARIEIGSRPDAQRVHLFTLAPDGRLLATERIPIR